MQSIKIALGLWAICLLCSCERRNIQNVSAEIKVVDAVTGQPVKGAEVLVAAVYDRPGMGRSDGDTLIRAISEPDGLVRTTLVQAFKVAAAAQAPGYLPARQKLDATTQRVAITIALHRPKPNPTLSKHLYYTLSIANDKELANIYSDMDDFSIPDVGSPVTLSMDYRYQERDFKVPDSYGIRLSDAATSRDTAICDFWLEPGPDDVQPNVLLAGDKGGLIPIFNPHYARSVVFDFDEAPAGGYQKRYLLTGKENGFFIRTRDGNHYGKFILNGTWSNFTALAYNKDEAYCEYRWQGSCLFQRDGSRHLQVDSLPVNLLYFLRGDIP